MKKSYHIIILKRSHIIKSVFSIILSLCLISYFTHYFSKTQQTSSNTPQSSNYVILASNDLGMHCYPPDYSGFMLLPPGNTLRVQVIRNEGKEAKLINDGIDVSYQIINNTTSSDKTNFWDYAMDYGYDVAKDIGITGNGLSGKMKLSEDKKFYEVTAIPVTPYNDGSTKLNPYQLAVIRVTDSNSGEELAMVDNVVVPVSDEMNCNKCHGATNTSLNILKSHDKLSNTNLVTDLAKGIRHKCAECHQDNILSESGKTDVMSLSQAMHEFHSDKMDQVEETPKCYSCHPGPISQCYRGIMYSVGVPCDNSKCHGNMTNVAKTIKEGRQPWLQEPDCSNCHGTNHATNKGQLYRNSYLINNSNPLMNGFLLCQSCHNSPHAEWKSSNGKDNLLPIKILGYANYINKCSVCHEGNGVIHQIE